MSQIDSNIGSEYGYDIGFVKHENEETNIGFVNHDNEETNVSKYHQNEVVSQITDAEKESAIMKAYRNNEMIEQDRATWLLVKQKAKEVIWPYTKFGNIIFLSDIDMFDEGTVLHRK